VTAWQPCAPGCAWPAREEGNVEREERGMDLGIDGLGLKQIVITIGLTFAITLAVMIGKRMSADALAIVVGIACGILASLPPLLILLVVVLRRDRKEERARAEEHRAMPPVIVVQGGAPQTLPPGAQAGYWPMAAPGMLPERSFQVIGGDDLLEGEWTVRRDR
jgi:hypothetical protein